VFYAKSFLHVSALNAPSSGRTLTASQNHCNFVTVAELQSMKNAISGYFTDLFKVIETILARCYGLKDFTLKTLV
jgi:hypothetical protein